MPRFDDAFGRQPEMLALFTRLFGHYPFASHTMVIADDDPKIPLEAQGASIFGASHLCPGWETERPVAHELAASGRPTRSRSSTGGGWPSCRRTSRLASPGPDPMLDDRVCKREALALHAIRLTVGDDAFFSLLLCWACEHAHGTVTTEVFIAFAEARTGLALRPLLRQWIYTLALPELPASP